VALAVVGALLLAAISLAWPAPTANQQPATLTALQGSVVPVLIPAVNRDWTTRSEVLPDGYRFTAIPVGGVPLTIEGRQMPFPDDPHNQTVEVRGTRASLRTFRDQNSRDDQRVAYWQENGVYYAFTSPDSLGNPGLQEVLDRLTPLDTAIAATRTWPGDTPLLYVFYLPLMLATILGAVWLMLDETRPSVADRAAA
jgi:hypothetical protein